MSYFSKLGSWTVAVAFGLTAPLAAQERGPVTNLPLPRYVSMKAQTGNVRRGPSLTHRVDWVFKQRGIPLEITAEYGHWRRIRDRDGAGGWVHYSLLSGTRTVIVQTHMLKMLSQPAENAHVVAELETGVIARIEECALDWCEISKDGYEGWVRKADIWGVGKDEIIE